MNFLARSLASRNPSATSMISQISSKSGTTIAQGLERSSCSCQGCLPRPSPPTAARACPQVPSVTNTQLLQLHPLGLLPRLLLHAGLMSHQAGAHQPFCTHRLSFTKDRVPQHPRASPSSASPPFGQLCWILGEGGNPPECALPLLSSPAHPTWPPLGSDRAVPWCQGLPLTRATTLG